MAYKDVTLSGLSVTPARPWGPLPRCAFVTDIHSVTLGSVWEAKTSADSGKSTSVNLCELAVAPARSPLTLNPKLFTFYFFLNPIKDHMSTGTFLPLELGILDRLIQ